MALGRGENIGEAYVRIVYSGEGAHLSKDIRDDLERDSPAFEAIGEEHSKAYNKGFKKEINKDSDVTMETLRKSLDKGVGKMEATGGKASSALMDGLEQDLKTKFGDDVGKVMAESLRERLQRGGTFESVQTEMSTSLEGLVRDATQKLQAGEKQTLTEQEKFTKDFRASLDKISSDAERAWTNGETAVDNYRSSLDRLSTQLNKVRQVQAQLVTSDFKRFETETKSLLRGDPGARSRGSLLDDFARLRGIIASNHLPLSHLDDDFKRNETRLREFTPFLSKATRALEGFGGSVGKFFGKGSRNNFLNFVGSFVGSLASLPSALTAAAEKVVGFGRKISGVFQEADSVGAGFVSLLSGVGSAAALGVVGITLLAAALAVLVLVVGPLVAALSLLLGALIALASTVILAAVAGVAALAGAFVPLALGVAAAVVGIAAFTSKAKGARSFTGPLHAAVTQLKSDFQNLGKVTAQGLFSNLPQQLSRVHDFMVGLDPLFRSAGVGASNFFDKFLNGLRSKAFSQFENEFSKVLPGMLSKLGDIAGHALTGLTGTLRALIPLTQHFLRWLDGIVTQWSNWANSKQGQEEIKSFLRNAATSAQSLGNFLKQAGGFLVDLIDSGNGAGNQMFDELTQKVKEFRDFVTRPTTLTFTNPRGFKDPTGDLPKAKPVTGPSGLDQWFKDAKKFADELGAAAVNFSGFLDKLDSPKSRQNLLTILDLVNKIASAINALPAIADVLFPLPTLIGQHLGDVISLIQKAFGSINFSHLLPDFSKLHGFNAGQLIKLPNIASLAAHFAGLGTAIRKEIGNINVSGIIHGAAAAVGGLLGAFAGTAGKILSRVSPVNVASIIVGAAAALAKLLDTFAGGAKKILDKVSPVNVSGIFSGLAAAAATLVSWAHSLASIIASIFSGIQIHINWPSPPSWLSKVTGLHTAAGGVFAGAQTRIIGEAGPEAVVPLNRPLNMVDPAVRWLSAIAQGKDMPMASGGVVGGGKQVTVTQNIFSPQADPRAVAVETINHLVAVGY